MKKKDIWAYTRHNQSHIHFFYLNELIDFSLPQLSHFSIYLYLDTYHHTTLKLLLMK